MTSPRIRLTGLQVPRHDDIRGYDRNMIVLAAMAAWVFLVLLGLVLTFS